MPDPDPSIQRRIAASPLRVAGAPTVFAVAVTYAEPGGARTVVLPGRHVTETDARIDAEGLANMSGDALGVHVVEIVATYAC